MVRWLRIAVAPLMLAGLITLAGLVLGRIYAGPLLAQLVAGAALGSVAVGMAARRLPSWSVAPLSVLLLAAYTAAALRLAASRAELTDPLPTIVTDALINGIPRLLTAMIPVEPTPDTVVVPIVAAWLAGLAGTELAVRAGRVLLGCLPAAALYAGALYVVGPNAGAAGWPTLAFAGLVVAGLATGKPSESTALRDVPVAARAAMRTRTLAGAAAGLVVVVGLIALVGPWVSGQVGATPVDPRRYVEPPQVDSLDESPLNRISGWALAPKQRLLEVRPEGAAPPSPAPPSGSSGGKSGGSSGGKSGGSSGAKPGSKSGSASGSKAGSPARVKAGERLRLAVLPDYDGVTWRVGATYRNAGRVLPRQPLLPDAEVEQVREEITVDQLTGRLLPVVPTPTGVDGARVAFDPATGTLIRPESLAPGLRYRVTSEVQKPDLNLLPTADIPEGATVTRFLTIGATVPEQIQRLADQLAEDNGAAYDRAVTIQDFLAEHYRKVADAPSGHAYPNLSFFLFAPRDRGGQIGTSEQFAASFALLARLGGLPSRVVVGFDVPAGGGTVTGADALAWPEVLFEDLGWVAFDPMPKSKEPPRPVEEDFTPKPPTPPPTTSQAPPPTDEASAAVAPSALAAAPGDGTPAAVVVGGASGSMLLVLALAGLAVVLMRRNQRQQRLTAGEPGDRIAGAWYEFTDALRLAGRPVPRHLAATEAAEFAAAVAPPLRKAAPPAKTTDRALPPPPDAPDAALRPPLTPNRALPPSETTNQALPPSRTPNPTLPPPGNLNPALPPPGTPNPAPPSPRTPNRPLPPAATPHQALPATPNHALPATSDPALPSPEAPDPALPPLDDLVAAVNTTAFAPGAADAEQADRAGAQAIAYADALRSRRSWWRRVWWSVHPGPLRWHRRR
jgi:transglutaminase-like putative cysteine protease